MSTSETQTNHTPAKRRAEETIHTNDQEDDGQAPALKIQRTEKDEQPNMSSSLHADPEGDCTFCCEDLTEENYVEYQAIENGPWLKSQYCQQCIEENFIAKQWDRYLENIAKADCAAALRRVLSSPPQINVKDAGLPCADNGHNDEVFQFWYASDNAVHSAKLKGSLVGAERDAFWSEKQAFLTATELQEELAKAEAAKNKDEEGK